MLTHMLRTIMTMTNSYARRRRGPKAGSTAIPFMITILISLIVFGGVALYFYNRMTAKSRELPVMQGRTERITEDDINTILFVLDPDNESKKNAVMLLHFDPIRKLMWCIGIPLELQVELDGRLMTVGACYDNHGAAQLKEALSQTLDEPVDRYMQLNSYGFKTLVNIFGNPKCTIEVQDDNLKKTNTPVTIDIDQYEALLTSNAYPSETERCTKIGLSVSQLLNECISPDDGAGDQESAGGKRIANNLESYFNNIINVVNTDIKAVDFENHKHAISYMFEHSMAPARCFSLACETHEDGTLTIISLKMQELAEAFAHAKLPEGSYATKKEESSRTESLREMTPDTPINKSEDSAEDTPADMSADETPADADADTSADGEDAPNDMADDPLAIAVPADMSAAPVE